MTRQGKGKPEVTCYICKRSFVEKGSALPVPYGKKIVYAHITHPGVEREYKYHYGIK